MAELYLADAQFLFWATPNFCHSFQIINFRHVRQHVLGRRKIMAEQSAATDRRIGGAIDPGSRHHPSFRSPDI
jgi:hypothetical protein